MLTVKTPAEVWALLERSFAPCMPPERLPLAQCRGRILARDVCSGEYVPGFHRSTVDGYAVYAADTFGCSDALPALLTLQGEVAMGQAAPEPLRRGCCLAVPTGGALPEGADAVVMLEYAEDYGDGSIGLGKSAAPGLNVIFKGDDVYPGKRVLPAGHRLTAADIGALAAMGCTEVSVCRKPVVAILSTGDELVDISTVPAAGQVRDVNSALLGALVEECGGEALPMGIVRDEEEPLRTALEAALLKSDVVLISGGSSVGAKDATERILAGRGELLCHGIAMKPGKPTILARCDGKAVFGLPGHPVAAFFITQLFVRPLLHALMGRQTRPRPVRARLSEAVSANHGREQYMGVYLSERAGALYARPIHGKSGLITSLAASDGYFSIPRDCEGLPEGAEVEVYLYSID